MKKIFRNFVVAAVMALTFGLARPALAQTTVAVSGDLFQITGSQQPGVANQTYIQFVLQNYSGNVPRVNGTGIIVPCKQGNDTRRQITPDSLGHFSTTLYGNDAITPSNTFYDVRVYANGQLVFGGSYLFTQALCPSGRNLDTYAQVNPPPTPAVSVAPFLGTNNIFTGTNTFNGAVTFGSTVTFGLGASFTGATINNSTINSPTITSPTISSGQIFAPDGTNAAPSYSFSSGHGNGLYSAFGHLRFADNGILAGGTNTSGGSAALGATIFDVGFAFDTLLQRDAAGTLAQKNSTNAQEFRVYGSTTGPKYLSLKHDGTNGIVSVVGGGSLLLGSMTVPSGTDQLTARNTTDTLTNKTLTGASNGNTVALLNFQGPQAQVTGTGALVTLYTYSLPANTLATGKGIRVTAVVAHSVGTASVSYQANFGATAVVVNSSSNTVGVNMYRATVFATGTSAEIAFNEQSANATPVSGFATPAENITGAITINFQFNVAATDKVTPEMFIVELMQ
jgi:hypothetical protein